MAEQNRRGIKRPKNLFDPFSSFLKDLMYLGLEQFGRYYSSYMAVVANVDDPENLNRLQLVIPEITEGVYLYWAFPKSNYAGKGYGVQLLPQRGDTVWVEFERGNPKVPIWSHGYFARDEKPQGEDLDDKNTYWLITPKGHKVIINDTKNYINILDSRGNQVWIAEDITIKQFNGKAIKLTGSEISIGIEDVEPGVIGDTLEEVITKLVDILKVAKDTGGFVMFPDDVIKLETWVLEELPKIKSKIVKINK